MTDQVLHKVEEFEYLIARGWPLLPCLPGEKRPHGKLVPNGVKGASTDRKLIAEWLDACPHANWAVATGYPGPQVLDIDNVALVPRALVPIFRSAPNVKTARGAHVYFRGTAAKTVTLTFGELRGVGSYVLIPPSTHPSGLVYAWAAFPNGKLPQVPGTLARTGSTNGAGRGEHVGPERVPYRQRHPYLKDFAARLVRAGFVDSALIECHLRCEFERICEPVPPPERGYFAVTARWWAMESDIAKRERRNGH